MALPQDIEDPKFEILKIGACSYRKLVINENINFKCEANRWHEDDDEGWEEVRELDDQMTYEGDSWVLKVAIPAVFHKFIVGRQASTKSRLEMESGATIVVPKRRTRRMQSGSRVGKSSRFTVPRRRSSYCVRRRKRSLSTHTSFQCPWRTMPSFDRRLTSSGRTW